jgi:hypothetical protein
LGEIAREKAAAGFISHRTLTGLRALGLNVSQIRIEVRSRKGGGVWVMARGFGNPIAHGRTLSDATAALVRILAPDEEVVQVVNGKRSRCSSVIL